MPAVVTEASVARAPSQSSSAGGRQQAGTDAASSPFSDLLDSCEPAPADAPNTPGAANTAAEPPRSEGATPDKKADAKADPVNIPAEQDQAKAQAQAQADLLQAIAAATSRPVPSDGKAEPTPAKVAPPGTAPEETQPDADTPAVPKDADAADANVASPPPPLPALAVPAAVAVPPPATLPVPPTIENVATTVTEAVPAAAPAAIEAAASVAKTDPAVAAATAEAETVFAKAAGLPTEGTAEPAPEMPAGEKQAAKAEKPAAAAPADPTSAGNEAAKPMAPAQDDRNPKAAGADPEMEMANANPPVEKTPGRPAAAAAAKALSADRDAPQPKDAANAASSNTPANPSLPAPAATQPAAAHAVPPSSQRFGASETVPIAGLAVEIAARAEAGKNHFQIRLDPPELGHIHVQLQIDGDGNVTSHLRVDRVETLDLLRREAPTLERALQDAGLKTADSGLQFSLRNQSFSQHDQGRDTPAMARIVLPDENVVPAETQRHYGRLAGLGGGVDIRV